MPSAATALYARPAGSCTDSIGDGDDDIALLVSLLDVPVGFDDLLQRVSPVDDRLELPCLGELPELDEMSPPKPRQLVVDGDECARGQPGLRPGSDVVAS